MLNNNYYIYILASGKNGTLYIGVTSNIRKRIGEHKSGVVDGFTKRYDVDKLVYYEITNDIYIALAREKQLKHWNRDWKINLIEKENIDWQDLSEDF